MRSGSVRRIPTRSNPGVSTYFEIRACHVALASIADCCSSLSWMPLWFFTSSYCS